VTGFDACGALLSGRSSPLPRFWASSVSHPCRIHPDYTIQNYPKTRNIMSRHVALEFDGSKCKKFR
jgi:hypothetical protein